MKLLNAAGGNPTIGIYQRYAATGSSFLSPSDHPQYHARLLHNQTAKAIIKRMEKYRNVYIFQIPYII